MDEKALLDAIGRMIDEKLMAEREHNNQMIDDKLEQSERRMINQLKAVVEQDGKKLDLILEGQRDHSRDIKELKSLSDRVDDHDHRIWALEQTQKA